jgi:pilus assembly protein CpaB
MRRGRLFIYIALILILGLAAVYIVGRPYLFPPDDSDVTSAEPTPMPTPATVDVVVVEQPIARGKEIQADFLTTVPYQEDLFLQGMYTNIDDVLGMLARFDLDSGVILTNNMLADSIAASREGSDAALYIEPGMIAVSIPISRLSSVSYAPRRGDHVSVIVTLLLLDLDTGFQSRMPDNTATIIGPGTTEDGITMLNASLIPDDSPYGRSELDPLLEETFYLIPSEPQRPRMVSQTLIQDVIVLQSGDFPTEEEEEIALEEADATPEPETVEEAIPEDEQVPEAPPKPPDVITLIVSPQDAVALNYLIYSGAELTLALRSPNDEQVVQTDAVTLQYLLDTYSIPVPVKLPYGMEPRADELIQPTLPNDATPTPEG